jgi:hypothetical protein
MKLLDYDDVTVCLYLCSYLVFIIYTLEPGMRLRDVLV